MDVKSLVSSPLPSPSPNSTLVSIDCKPLDSEPRSVSVKIHPPTPTSPDPRTMSSSPLPSHTTTHGTSSDLRDSASADSESTDPLKYTASATNITHSFPEKITSLTSSTSVEGHIDVEANYDSAYTSGPQDHQLENQQIAVNNEENLETSEKNRDQIIQKDADSGKDADISTPPTHTPSPSKMSRHKRMLSTVTEDREIKRPVNIITTGINEEPQRTILVNTSSTERTKLPLPTTYQQHSQYSEQLAPITDRNYHFQNPPISENRTPPVPVKSEVDNPTPSLPPAGSASTEAHGPTDSDTSSPPKTTGLAISLSKISEPPIAVLSSSTISSTSSSSRRHAHILSEQRRRENINGGFQLLKNSVPFCKGTQDSKAMILKKAVEYIMSLEQELGQLRFHEGMQHGHSHSAPQHSPVPHLSHSHHASSYGPPQGTNLPPLGVDPRYAPSYSTHSSHIQSLPPPHLPVPSPSPGVSPSHHPHHGPPGSSPSSLRPLTPVHSMSSPISSRTPAPAPLHHPPPLHHAHPPPHYSTASGVYPPIARPTSTPPFHTHGVYDSRRNRSVPTTDEGRYPSHHS